MTAVQEIAVVAEYLHRAHQIPKYQAVRAAGNGYLRARHGVTHDVTAAVTRHRDDPDVLELASRNGQHVPGTPYSWRHGWIPLNVATALMYRKRRHAERLHAEGAPFNAPDADIRPIRGGLAARKLDPAALDDNALESGMQTAIRAERWDLLDALGNEADRRDAARAKRADKADRDRVRRDEQANAMLDRMGALIDEGVPEADAHAEVYGGSPEAYQRKQAIQELRAQGYKGAGFDALARDSFRAHVANEYLRAESETRGVMLSREAESANARAAARRGKLIDPEDLFTGNAATARKYASKELRSWWDANGRPTLPEWKAQLMGDLNAARNLRARRDAMAA